MHVRTSPYLPASSGGKASHTVGKCIKIAEQISVKSSISVFLIARSFPFDANSLFLMLFKLLYIRHLRSGTNTSERKVK